MSFWRQALEFTRRDLVAERRANEVLTIVLPFGAVALMVVPLTLGVDSAVLSRVGPSIFWVVTLLFTMQIALRHSAADRRHHRTMLSLLGVDPLARLIGRSLASALLIAGFMAVLFPLMILFYTPDLPSGWVKGAAPAALAALGLGLIGTLAAEVTAGLRSRTTLASLIVAPLAVPLVIGGSQGLESLARGDGILPWAMLVAAADLALAVTAALIARPLEEAAR